MKTETNLRLSGAKSALAAAKPDNTDDRTDPALPAVDDSMEDADTAAATDSNADSITGGSATGGTETNAPGDRSDRTMAYALITKSWTSGGIAGTGKDRVTIEAAYWAARHIRTGAVNLWSKNFRLKVTDLNTGASSGIDSYPFSNTEWTEIPVPEDAGKFEVRGDVKIDVQTSGKMMRVRLHMNTASHLSDIGYIFVLDIPENTKFIDGGQSEPAA